VTLPLLVRRLAPSEHSFVLASWKTELFEMRYKHRWSKGLETDCFWALANYVIDKITFPSCDTFVGCAPAEPGTPLCWVAVRKVPGLSQFDLVFMHARSSVRADKPLAAVLETTLLSEVQKTRPLVYQRRNLNLFHELKR
jgi:hypothetical protein